jgi:hypothetical protein
VKGGRNRPVRLDAVAEDRDRESDGRVPREVLQDERLAELARSRVPQDLAKERAFLESP